MKKEDSVRLLLTLAVKNAAVGLGDAYKAVNYNDQSVLNSAITTLARLKMLEVTVLQTMAESLGIPAIGVPQISDDIGKTVLINMVLAKAITPDDARAMFPDYKMGKELERAVDGVPPYDSHESAHKTLTESLIKIYEKREE